MCTPYTEMIRERDEALSIAEFEKENKEKMKIKFDMNEHEKISACTAMIKMQKKLTDMEESMMRLVKSCEVQIMAEKKRRDMDVQSVIVQHNHQLSELKRLHKAIASKQNQSAATATAATTVTTAALSTATATVIPMQSQSIAHSQILKNVTEHTSPSTATSTSTSTSTSGISRASSTIISIKSDNDANNHTNSTNCNNISSSNSSTLKTPIIVSTSILTKSPSLSISGTSTHVNNVKHTHQSHLVRTPVQTSKLSYTPLPSSVNQKIPTPLSQSHTQTETETETECLFDRKKKENLMERKINQDQNNNKNRNKSKNQNKNQNQNHEDGGILSSRQDNEQNILHANDQLGSLGEGSSFDSNHMYNPQILDPRFLYSANDGGRAVANKGQYSDIISNEGIQYSANDFPKNHTSISINKKGPFPGTDSNVNSDINMYSYNYRNVLGNTNILDKTNIHEYYGKHNYSQHQTKNEHENENENENENEDLNILLESNYTCSNSTMERIKSDDMTLSHSFHSELNHEYRNTIHQNFPHTYWTTSDMNHDCTYDTSDTSNNQFYPYSQSQSLNNSNRKNLPSIPDNDNFLRTNSDFLLSSQNQYEENSQDEVQDFYQNLYRNEQSDINDTESR